VRKNPATSATYFSEIIREASTTVLHQDEAVAYSLAYARDMNSQLASKFLGM
jgi:hypothetical protein